jgi:tetratricopeptide (TPR) repeat protein
MGGAFTGIADDVSASYWNPAGLSLLEHRELGVMHVTLYEETVYDYAAAAWPVLDLGTIAVSGIRLGSTGIEFRDQFGPRGTYDYSTGQYWLSFARRLFGFVHGGSNLKIISENLGDFSATTASVDFGLLLTPFRAVSLGVTVQDALGGGLKLSSEEEEIPRNIKAGIGAKWRSRDKSFAFIADLDVDMTEGQPVSGHIGSELMLFENLFARVGYDREYVTFGGGVKYGLAAVDYAYKTHDVLGSSHRIGLTLFFGPTIEEQRQTRDNRRRENEQERLDSERRSRADVLWDAASDAYDRNQLDSAEVLCSQVLGYDPSHDEAKALMTRIRSLLEQQTREEIEAQSEQKATENLIAERLDNARGLFESGKLAESRAEFDEVLRLDPDNTLARDGLLQIDAEVDRQVRSYIARGDERFAAGQFAEAIVQWSRALALKPDLREATRKTARARALIDTDRKVGDAVQAYSESDTATARRLFEEVLDIDSTNQTAISYIVIMDREQAPVVAMEELKGDAEYWKIYLEGVQLFRDKKFDKAIDKWELVLQKYPGSREALQNIEQAKLRKER